MRLRTVLVAMAVACLSLGQRYALGNESDGLSGFQPTSSDYSLQPHPQYLDVPSAAPSAPPLRPIMMALDQVGLAAPLHRLGIDIYGHVEGSYTANFNNPSSKQNPFRLFDFQSDKFLLDQIDISIERVVNYHNAKHWDIGFHVEFMWGADAGFIHSNGLFDYFDSPRNPENQPDLTQAYFDIVAPVGTGLRIRVGKFVNLVGYESINPTIPINPGAPAEIDFFSRSFIFSIGYPFTHTGILVSYDISKNVSFTGGVTRGDDQSVRDNNSAAAFLGSLNWYINKHWSLYVSNSTGPEQARDDGHYRTTWDATLYYTPDDHWSFAANGYYLYDAAGNASGGPGHLYALALMAGYKMNDYVTLKGRGEWYHDPEGVRAPVDTDLYGITVGASIYPFPHDKLGRNLKIRPEFRYDFSDHKVFNGREHQATFEMDVVMKL